MTDESWYVVRNTPGVTGFVGSAGAGSKPNPLLPEEVRFILKQMGLKEKTIDVELDVGEQVRIQSGPFANQVGEVQEIEADKFKLTVLVDMFGRETPVEVEFDQIEKIIKPFCLNLFKTHLNRLKRYSLKENRIVG